MSVLHPASTGNRLVERMLANPEWAAGYRTELERALAGPCESQRLTAAAGVLAGRVREAVVDESYAARAAFDRIALGRGGAGADRGDEDPLPGPGGPGMREDQPLADWIALRTANAKAELEGRRQAPPPSMTRP